MSKIRSFVSDERGLTMVELLVAVTIAVLVLAPIYETLLVGNKVQMKSFGQVSLQEKAQEIMKRIVEGTPNGTKGLRQASAARILLNPSGLTFVTGGKQIIWYMASGKLYYKETIAPAETAVPPGTLLFNPVGGTPVLDNVTSFKVQQSLTNNKLYNITLQLSKNVTAAGKNQVVYNTSVRPRNN